MKKTILLLALLAIVSIASAQTNVGWVLGEPPSALPSSTSTDISKVLSDFGIHVSVSDIAFALMVGIPLVNVLAKYARKIIPDSAQANKLGLTLAHVAGEVNPSIQKLQAAAVEVQAISNTVQPNLPAQPPKP